MPDAGETRPPSAGQSVSPVPRLMAGVLFGLAFGVLLQKGGVAKFHVLIGLLLLQDFTVAKVMLTAIVVGMIGVLTLHHFGKVNLHLKPTRIGANVIGGLLFGAGFALLGYCPGTVAAALGQGSWDALFGMAGLVAGSWIFAELSGWSKRTVEKWGDLGEVLLPDLLHVPRSAFAIGLGVALTSVILVLERFTIR
ncbi:MAG: YeeE/YedE family protein [Geobacter sp.]|nr:MAG: YeeE/YedE family protein [Geobacter sp.]